MVDQYYLTLPSSGGDKLETPENVEAKISISLKEGILSEPISTNELGLNCVVHGPFSSFDLRSYGKDGKEPERRGDVPAIKEVDLSNELNVRFNSLTNEQKAPFRKAYWGLKQMEAANGILGYEPTPLGRLDSNIYLSATDYLSAFLLELSFELTRIKHSGNRTVVLHPETLFYIAGNSKENMSLVAKYLNEIAGVLKYHLVFENVVFVKNTYKKAFPWAENMASLKRIINSYHNLGICIDVMHLLRISQNGNQEIMAQNAVELLRDLSKNGKPVVIHARASNGCAEGISSDHEVMGKVISEAYKRGIPVVYEPDNY